VAPIVCETCHHPGAYLQELLIWHDLSAEELARETALPCNAIVELTAARRPVDGPISRGLAAYFGNSAQYWLELQNRFDHQRRRETRARRIPARQKKPAD